jgi:hypothetical protein
LLNTRYANIYRKILSFQVKIKLTHIMKKATKIATWVFTVALLFTGVNSFAQSTPKSKFRFGVGLETLVPTGDLHTYSSNFGLGITPRLQYGITDRLALTFTSGYYHFFPRTVHNPGLPDVNTGETGIVPVKLGLKAFINKNIYFGAEIGAGFEVNDGGGNTKLLTSAGVGYASKKWDVGIRYENFSGQTFNYGTIGLRVAYGFGL